MRLAFLPPIALLLLLTAACNRPSEVPEPPDLDTTRSEARDLLSLLQEHEELQTFVRLADTVGLRRQLRGIGPLTLFAPTDDAFRRARLSVGPAPRPTPGSPAAAGTPRARRDTLSLVLRYHTAQGRYTAARVQASRGDSLRVVTLLDEPVMLRWREAEGGLHVQGRPVRTTVVAENGVLHVLDDLLPPPDTSVVETLRDRTRR